MISNHGTARLGMLTVPALLALAAQAQADDYLSPTNDHIRLSLGAMHVSSATSVRADSTAGVTGTAVSGEGTFGLDKSDFEPKFQATVRVATRQRLSFDYFSLDRSGNSTLTGTPVTFKDVSLLPGDPLQTQLNLRMLGISYGYSFWHSEKVEIAATLGVHSTDVSAEVRVQTPTRHIIQQQDTAGPIPTLGLDATWCFSKRFYAGARAQYLKVNVSNINGSLGIYEVNGLYRYRENVALGIGYTDIKAQLASTRSGQAGLFDFSTKGPEIFFRISF